MIKNILILTAIIAFLFSCKKDEAFVTPAVPSNTSNTPGSFLPLTVGNYWIYQKSIDDSIGTYQLQQEFDSVYVEKDTLINNTSYFKVSHSNLNFGYYYLFQHSNISHVYLRDSAGFLITDQSELLLDTLNIGDTIQTEIYGPGFYAAFVPKKFSSQSFEIGTFSGFLMSKCFLFPATELHKNGSSCYQAFVKNIGLSRARMLFITNPYHTLFSYHLIRHLLYY